MPRGQYDRSAARLRRESPVTSMGRAKVARDENWGKRTRRHKGEINYRELIPEDEKPDDAMYQWKTFMVLGKEDESKMRTLAENGWSPVPHERHPYMPKMGPNIVDGDAILMEQPIELYEEAVEADRQKAKAQMDWGKQSIGETPGGQMDRRNLGTRVNVAPMVIQSDDSKYEHNE